MIQNRAAGILAATTAVALVLSACGGDSTPVVTIDHGPVVVTFAYWGQSGIAEDATGLSLEEQYEASHPWIDLELIPMDKAELHEGLTQSLIAGSDAPDIVVVDEASMAEYVALSDSFVNLLDLGAGQYKDDFLPWTWGQASNQDGSVVIGLGADVDGLALCYRKDLFQAAGLPSDRDDVSAALGDSWQDFIAIGESYWAAAGRKLIDNATNVFHPAVMQLGTGHGYYDLNDELDMDNVKPAFDTALYIIESGLSANIGLWSPEWNVGLSNGDFAVTLCPSWMLGYIEDHIDNGTFEGQWDVADIPGPGGNWGGSFYTIPKHGTEYEQQEAYNFLEWLIQEEQQLKIVAETGNLPAQISILESDAVAGLTNEFFNDAPYGEIFATTVLDLPAPIYHSRCEADVRTAVESVLNQTQAGNVPLGDLWAWAITCAEAAGGPCSPATGG